MSKKNTSHLVPVNLEDVKKFILSKYNLNVFILEKNVDELPDVLFVKLFKDRSGREYNLQIIIYKTPSFISGIDFSEDYNPENYIIQLAVLMPFKAKSEHTYEVCRFLTWINRTIEIPGFEFNENDGSTYYRYNLMVSNKIDPLSFLSVLGNIRYYIEQYFSLIEEVGLGEKTLLDIVKSAYSDLAEEEGGEA
jgi:hypothetical protein